MFLSVCSRLFGMSSITLTLESFFIDECINEFKFCFQISSLHPEFILAKHLSITEFKFLVFTRTYNFKNFCVTFVFWCHTYNVFTRNIISVAFTCLCLEYFLQKYFLCITFFICNDLFRYVSFNFIRMFPFQVLKGY